MSFGRMHDCYECGAEFERQFPTQFFCRDCWKSREAESWKASGCPKRKCRDCKKRFSPEVGYERHCHACQAAWACEKREAKAYCAAMGRLKKAIDDRKNSA